MHQVRLVWPLPAEPILIGLGDVTIIEGACLATLEVTDVRDLNLRQETAA